MGLYRLIILGLCFLSFHVSISLSFPQSILPEIHGSPKIIRDDSADEMFCDSWRLTVETNDAGSWSQIPLRCEAFVMEYMTGKRYPSDCEVVANFSLEFAKSVVVTADDPKNSWVFAIDETLLSNVPYRLQNGFRPYILKEKSFDDDRWLPPLPSSLRFYNELKGLKFKIFILTGRNESLRTETVLNLEHAGYSNWQRLIMRGPDDEGTPVSVYKSKKRKEIENEGYKIRGSSGDQWSDLIGYAVAERSFKIPNPMYYVA